METTCFEKYIYTEEEKLLDYVNKIAFGEGIDNEVTVVESTKTVKWNWSMDEINAVVCTIASMTHEKYLCSYYVRSIFRIANSLKWR